jgi:hypothetical protein
MTALLRQYVPNYRFEDYLAWEGRWELIDGIAYAMSGVATLYRTRIS